MYMETELSKKILDKIYGRKQSDIIAMDWTTKQNPSKIGSLPVTSNTNQKYGYLTGDKKTGKNYAIK